MRKCNSVFMIKRFNKTLMHISKLRKTYNKYQSHKNWRCNSQQNHLDEKRKAIEMLNAKEMNDNKTFWGKIKPYFNKYGSSTYCITLKRSISTKKRKSKYYESLF